MTREAIPSALHWGIDCGSTEIKVVALDPATLKIAHRHRQRTLFPLLDHVRAALTGSASTPTPFADPAKTLLKPGHTLTATGYGRAHIPFATEKLTEIKAHFLGVEHLLHGTLAAGQEYTLIDIGGQDSKVVKTRHGQIDEFIINRKCAAGTGAYIEELAHRLEIPLQKLTELEARHDQELVLNSFCTVFAGQEVIKILMNGERVENLIHALYQSVVKRVLEMTAIETEVVVFSGGVFEHHPALRNLFAKRLPDRRFFLCPEAQYCGAIGAAYWTAPQASNTIVR